MGKPFTLKKILNPFTKRRFRFRCPVANLFLSANFHL